MTVLFISQSDGGNSLNEMAQECYELDFRLDEELCDVCGEKCLNDFGRSLEALRCPWESGLPRRQSDDDASHQIEYQRRVYLNHDAILAL